MEELKNEQTEQNSQTAVAEKDLGESNCEVSLGKFKDVSALLSAYNSLQSEFTKRCQRVKELETELSSVGKTNAPTPDEDKKHVKEDTILQDKEKILKEYLLDVIGKKPKAIVMDGGISVKTPVNRPKTIAEAGNLAKEILEN
jgi:hypothetical protein